MKKRLKKLSKPVLVILAVLLMLIPNLQSYSSVGNFATNSNAVLANEQYAQPAFDSQKPQNFLAVIAVAAAIVTFAAGVVDGWNAVRGSNITASNLNLNYNPQDFSKYD